MRIYSWNVNGLRAASKKGYADWLGACEGDIVGLQEVRSLPEQLTAAVREPEGWWTHFFPAERKGYSGVALYARQEPDYIETSLGKEEFDIEGRYQLARWGDLTLVNAYFPNGSGKNRDHSRVPYKLDFYRAVYDRLEEDRQAGKAILVMGDFNTAHEEIDLARPKTNHKTSGFLPIERAEVTRWIEDGWVDTFRNQHPGEEGHYSWWSQRGNCRARNVGWRIDYVMASAGAMERLQNAFIHPHVMGSDHCPIGVDIDS